MELMNLDSVYLPVLPGVHVQVRDLRVEVELSDCLLPSIHIEGNLDIRFGKRSYGLNRIMAHLQETSFCVIGIALLCMNLTKRLRALLHHFLRIWFLSAPCPVFAFLGLTE